MKKNIFGQTILIKRLIIAIVGLITHRTFRSQRFQIIGSKYLNNIPEKNVLFVSNHQTYFYDVIAMLHVFNSSAKGRIDTVKKPNYLVSPRRQGGNYACKKLGQNSPKIKPHKTANRAT